MKKTDQTSPMDRRTAMQTAIEALLRLHDAIDRLEAEVDQLAAEVSVNDDAQEDEATEQHPDYIVGDVLDRIDNDLRAAAYGCLKDPLDVADLRLRELADAISRGHDGLGDIYNAVRVLVEVRRVGAELEPGQ